MCNDRSDGAVEVFCLNRSETGAWETWPRRLMLPECRDDENLSERGGVSPTPLGRYAQGPLLRRRMKAVIRAGRRVRYPVIDLMLTRSHSTTPTRVTVNCEPLIGLLGRLTWQLVADIPPSSHNSGQRRGHISMGELAAQFPTRQFFFYLVVCLAGW